MKLNRYFFMKVKRMTDSPRLLTKEEIKYVLDRLEPPQIMIPELRDRVLNQIKTIFAYQLANDVKIKPSKIDKLAAFISNKSARSFFQPGSPIGFNVAESVGQPVTQMVLNTFHSAGQSGKSGFDRFERNIKPRDPKKHPEKVSMKIHMMNKDYSFEDLYIKSQQFVNVTIDDLLDKDTIIREEYPFSDMSMYTEDFKAINTYVDKGCAIRLRFDQEKLFLHQIPLERIAMELEKVAEGNLFTVFFGPQIEGVIDVYPNTDVLCTSDMKNIEECCSIFENGTLKNKLQSIKLGEFSNITSAAVKKVSIVDTIEEVTPHYEEEDTPSPDLVRVWIKRVFIRKEGIPIEKLEQLLEITGYPIVDTDPAGYFYIVRSESLDVKERINKMLADENTRLMEEFSETKRLSSTPLYLAGYYNSIETIGSNLAEVRIHPEVDEYNTISDSILEIYRVLGLEVARAFIEKEIYDLFEQNDQKVAPRNISIMADWMTAYGRPIAVNTKSVPRSESSIMRAVCFEDPKANIIRGAVTSTEEYLANVSAKVLFGVQQSLGTGAFEVKEDPEISKLYESFRDTSDSARGYRLTSKTLSMPRVSSVVSSKIPDRPAIPDAESDLFGSGDDDGLSVGESLDFQV